MNSMIRLHLIVFCYPQEFFMDFMMNWFSSINFIRLFLEAQSSWLSYLGLSDLLFSLVHLEVFMIVH